jgi:anti-sigma regulatory factor (Ser/Thr protein kinase)
MSPAQRTKTGFVHDALYYDSDEALVAVALPFLQGGMAAGDSVAVSAGPRTWSVLATALGGDQERLVLLPGPDTFQRTATAVSALRGFFDAELAAGARGLRVLGEVPESADPQEWAEWCRYEAIINRVLEPYPVWGLCPYDTRSLPESVLAAGQLTHPIMTTRTDRAANPAYLDPVEFLHHMATEPSPLAAGEADVVMEVGDLRRLRHAVRATVTNLVPRSRVVAEFLVAVNEVATNARLHGRPPVTARLWVSPQRLVCAITDRGSGFDDAMAGYAAPVSSDPARPGRGLWLARHLCDQITAGHTPEGFTVRLSTRAAAQGPREGAGQ